MKFPGHALRLRHKTPAQLSLDLPRNPIAEAVSPVLKTMGWVSAGVGAVALGLVVGRELRLRYKIKRRTPYDRYAHAGASFGDDFGIGI